MYGWRWLAFTGSIIFGAACGGSDRHTETPADTQGTTPAMDGSGGSPSTDTGTPDSSGDTTSPSTPESDTGGPPATSPSPGTSTNEGRPDVNSLAALYDARSSLGSPVEPMGQGGMHSSGGRSSSTGGRSGIAGRSGTAGRPGMGTGGAMH